MTDVSTSLLMVGPTGVGPFRSPDWRVSSTIQLVEGSGNGPYWLFTDHKGSERVLMIDSLFPEVVASSVVLLVSVVTGNESAISVLEATHNVSRDDAGNVEIAPFWDLADEVERQLATLLAPVARLGFVTLDETTIASNAVYAHLLNLGFTVESFISQASMA